ncbi:uncharacterized protein E6C27_scaffold511G001540 [Cucumis melo var. makuwa]|uniref:Uncharacterized protein n=1 Tax=Cucumis melo var. makuwa TaxID=1194695 RepID=A0A5A7U7A3_CUCMM|nr:uncharacterized protein E6C27_scaffold511G001540 [Cucumis melo var. makuwa]
MSTSYSMWPVVLIPYNLPPWKCMKESNFFISLLIPDPRSSGREIDVYLQLLIEELKELWTFGVRTMLSFPTGFEETNSLFPEFDNAFNNMEGSFSVGNTSKTSILPKHGVGEVHPQEGKIPFTISPGAEKPISPHVVRFGNTIGNTSRWSIALYRSNQGSTRMLDRSSLTTIVAGSSHFYDDSMSSLNNENQMLELQSQTTLKSSNPLFGNEI